MLLALVCLFFFLLLFLFSFFFFNDTATTEIYTLSLHDALPISESCSRDQAMRDPGWLSALGWDLGDRKSTRLNSSHITISYAVFCLKKKKKEIKTKQQQEIQYKKHIKLKQNNRHRQQKNQITNT